jgi:phosphoesterase RecJ-like protein
MAQLSTVQDLDAVRQRFFNEIRAARRILIGSHLNPDGDSIGSALALVHICKLLGVEYEWISHDPVPDNLAFLPGTKEIRETPRHSDHDLAIILDLDAVHRLGRVRTYFEQVPRWIVVDHHVPTEQPGDFRIVMVGAPATCAILADLCLGPRPLINADLANCLLTGILTDTGSFRFPNTTPHSLHLAAQLIEAGANLPRLAEEIYHRRTQSSLRLLGWALNNMKIEENGRLAYVAIPHRIYEELGCREQDTEGIVNELLSIGTVEVAALLRKVNQGKVRGSLRSRQGHDVAAIARQFGGGGHSEAAGVSFAGELEQALDQLLPALRSCWASS